MTLPLIGAALDHGGLVKHRDWILAENRDLEVQSFLAPKLLAGGDWRPLAEATRALLDGYSGRLGLHGPFWGFTIASQDPDVQALVARRFDQGLDICATIGATQMVVHSPYTTWDYNNLDDYPTARDDLIADVHASIGAAVRRAEDQGVTLVVENIEDIDPADRRRLIESFGSDALRLSIDTGHAHYAHISTGAPPVDYFVSSAGALLEHVHLQDCEGYADRHWSLGEGTIRWPSVFRALAALPLQPRIVLELRNAAHIPASMRFLREMGLGR